MSPLDPAFAHALERVLAEVSPASPPEACIANIAAIAVDENVVAQRSDLVTAFLEHHRIDPDGPAIIAILRQGYRVYAKGDDDEVIEALTNVIIGETLASADVKSDWSAQFGQFAKSIAEEIEHVLDTMHPAATRSLVGRLLLKHVLDRYYEIVEEAFPHLKADPRRIGAFVRDMRQGAVLLLGQDSTEEGMTRIARIREVIDSRSRTSLLIKEQQDLDEQGLVAKLLLNSALARYVIVENTFASGHLFEMPFLQNAGVIVAVLQEHGRGSSHMPNDLIDNSSMMRRYVYTLDELRRVVIDAMDWAEARLAEVAAANRADRPWLSNDEDGS
jgi:hypothetical protein